MTVRDGATVGLTPVSPPTPSIAASLFWMEKNATLNMAALSNEAPPSE